MAFGPSAPPPQIDLPSLFDSMFEGVQIIDFEGRYVYLNETAASQGRYSRDVLVGRPMTELYPGIEKTEMYALLTACLSSRAPQRMINQFIYPDGQKGWFDLRFNAVPMGALILSVDVSEWKRLENEVQRGEQMERRLQAMVERSDEMITLRDEKGDLLYASPSMQQTMGYTPEEIASLGFGQLIHPDDRDVALAAFARVQPGQSLRGQRMRVQAKNGHWLWLEGSLSNFLDDPAVAAVVANFRDVTERLQLEEHLAQAGKMESIGHLAAGIAHDFNNLVTVITGYSEMALHGMPATDPGRELIEPVVQAAYRAAALTRQLLAFSRKQVLKPQVLDLNVVVEGMGTLLARALGEDVEIVLRLAPRLSLVSIDPSQLEQIIMNLAVNARDAMPRGGQLSIETAEAELDADYVRTHREGRPGPHVVLAITDTGTGMDAATRAQIFEPFFTTKEVGHGTGLGLSTVYGIVKQSGGSIWVYSEPGMGTSFKVYLPKVEDAPTRASAADPSALPAGRETILLVEDEPSLRALFKRFLSLAGYQVIECLDAAQALDRCREHEGEIHLLLTDVIMPKMGGQKLAEEAQKMRPGLKVAFMSGYTDDAIVNHGILKVGTAFIQKPINREGLLKKVREFLDGGAA